MKIKSLIFAVCLTVVSPAAVLAADNPLYVGLKGGVMMVDLSEYDQATSAGVVLGYKIFGNADSSLAIEGEYTTSSSADINVLGFKGKWDIDTWAAYLAYRIGGDMYFKGKVGYLNEDINVDIVGANISGSDSGLSVGIGVGWKLGKKNALELEYTVIEQDVNFVSLGVNFSF
ncbi:MAG: porin family protein [Gammaproteobacteria bacterium]|nr:porin family protein [Gammaproteobacteria bacterium]